MRGTLGLAKSKGCLGGLFFLIKLSELLIELVDPPGRIHKLHLTGEERMRVAGNLQFNQRVLFAVFPYDSVARRSARAG